MIHDIQAILQREVDAWEQLGHPCLLNRFVLACGTAKAGRSRPPAIEKRQFKECFANSTRMSWERPRKFKYVEGVAISEVGLPCHHAWNEDERGRIIDTTWQNPERCTYMGVRFTATELNAELSRNGVYGVLDTGLGYNTRFMYKKVPELQQIVERIRQKDLTGAL